MCVFVRWDACDSLFVLHYFISEFVGPWMEETGESVFTNISVWVQVPGVNSWACKYVWDQRVCFYVSHFRRHFPVGCTCKCRWSQELFLLMPLVA